jgi:hypothetical protein
LVHVVGLALALMFAGAITVVLGLRAERRTRRALPPAAPPPLLPLHDWEGPTPPQHPSPPEEAHVRRYRPYEDDDDECATNREPPRDATSPWSATDVDDAQLEPRGQALALAPGRHTIIVVCGDCAKVRTIHKQLAERASFAEIADLVAHEDEPPITSAPVFEPIDEEPLRHAHGGRATPAGAQQTPRHATDPWDFAHHDRRRRR